MLARLVELELKNVENVIFFIDLKAETRFK